MKVVTKKKKKILHRVKILKLLSAFYPLRVSSFMQHNHLLLHSASGFITFADVGKKVIYLFVNSANFRHVNGRLLPLHMIQN